MTNSASVSSDAGLRAGVSAARRICRQHAAELIFPTYFLPASKRRVVYALGAFAVMVRRALEVPRPSLSGAAAMREHPSVVSPTSLPVIQPHADDAHCSADTIDTRGAMLRDRLDEIYAGRLELPAIPARSLEQHALAAFADTVRRFGIPQHHWMDLADGCRIDQTMRRFDNWEELNRYCARTGGAVALVISSALGLTHSGAFQQAAVLGTAIRLALILRDLPADWEAGRLYLPREDLVRFGYTEDDLAAKVVNERFREMIHFQIERTRRLFREGAESICWLAEDGSRLAAAMWAVHHAGLLDAIERRRCDVFTRRARLTHRERLARLGRAWKLARRQPDQPLPEVL